MRGIGYALILVAFIGLPVCLALGEAGNDSTSATLPSATVAVYATPEIARPPPPIIIPVAPVPPPPAPAAFSVSNLSIQPAEVQPKEAVTITVSVANTGGTEGSYTVVLKINGVKEAEKRVTIAAGGSEAVTFSVAKEEAGSYSVTVDGLSGSFTVVAPEAPPEEVVPPPEEVVPPLEEIAPPDEIAPPVNWPLVGGIIAVVVVAGLLIFFLIFKNMAKRSGCNVEFREYAHKRYPELDEDVVTRIEDIIKRGQG